MANTLSRADQPGFFLSVSSQNCRQSGSAEGFWIASRNLSSGAHSRDPLARNDGEETGVP
jgi:hypothetical protein